MQTKNQILQILFIAALIPLGSCQLQENKETLQSEEVSNNSTGKITIADVEKGIRANIGARTKAGGGYFNFTNDTTDFSLKLVRVHTEYLSVLKKDEFFACVDLATEDGDVYDMDFFLKGTRDDMHVTRTTLHKLNGKPYYSWKQMKDKTWLTVPVKNASNDLLGVIEGADEFTFNYKAKLPEINGPGKMWIPIAQSDQFQTIKLLSINAPTEYQIINDQEYANSILFIEVNPVHSGQTISINYKVNRTEKSPYKEMDPDLVKYLQPSSLMPVGARFSILADEIFESKQSDSPLTKARALYDYVIENVRYAKQGVYGTGDANYACDSKSGNCTEFHSLFISLARSAGIPARFAVGAAIPSSRDEGGVDGYHCWAEFYAEGKWWPIDISEADKYTALATYYFGHHPANRIEFSRGRDISPDPLPKSGRINFLAYPVLEIKGKPDLVETTFTFKRNNKNS